MYSNPFVWVRPILEKYIIKYESKTSYLYVSTLIFSGLARLGKFSIVSGAFVNRGRKRAGSEFRFVSEEIGDKKNQLLKTV